jgi:hypothetical protein
MVLTGSFVLSPVTGLFATVASAMREHCRYLMPASGHQDHTTSPSALAPLVWPHHRVHRIPRPTSVTIAIRPSCERETREEEPLICPTAQAHIFASRLNDQIDLNGFSN